MANGILPDESVQINEEWRKVDGHAPYEASSLGRIRSCFRGPRILVPRISLRGYYEVTLHGKTRKVHRIIADAFLGTMPFVGAQVRHLNGSKTDNRIENLKWGTAKENTLDSFALGELRLGSSQTGSKLTEDQVAEIKVMIGSGASQRGIGRMYGVSGTLIHHIARGKTWRHVK